MKRCLCVALLLVASPVLADKHQINFGGILPSMVQAVTCTLIVE